MWRTILNLEVMASHIIPRPQPQEEAQWPILVTKVLNPKQVAKHEP
jgi:hypothetical protein